MTPRPLARFAVVFALALMLVALVGCGLQPSARLIKPVGPALSASLAIPPAPALAVAPVAPVAPAVVGAFEVRAASLAFEPGAIAVAAPGVYSVRVVNNDAVPHEVAFDDGTRIVAQPGQSATALVDIPAEGSAFLCVLPAHSGAGLVGQVTVEE